MATNFYSAAKNDPAVLAKRKQRIAKLDADIQHMQTSNPRRKPSWDEHRIMELDRAALEMGKRCIMWDDSGNGFFLMLNWDWVTNRPAAPPTPEAAFDPGWWLNAKQLLQPPLIDPTIPENKLAAWIDAHTMNVHYKLLEKKDKVTRAPAVSDKDNKGPTFVLNDPYWDILQALPR